MGHQELLHLLRLSRLHFRLPVATKNALEENDLREVEASSPRLKSERPWREISKIPGVRVDLLQHLVDVDDVGFFFWTLLFLQSRPTVKA